MQKKRSPRMHAVKTMPTPGATPLWTAPSRPKCFGVAPGVGDRLQASVLTAWIQKRNRLNYGDQSFPLQKGEPANATFESATQTA